MGRFTQNGKHQRRARRRGKRPMAVALQELTTQLSEDERRHRNKIASYKARLQRAEEHKARKAETARLAAEAEKLKLVETPPCYPSLI